MSKCKRSSECCGSRHSAGETAHERRCAGGGCAADAWVRVCKAMCWTAEMRQSQISIRGRTRGLGTTISAGLPLGLRIRTSPLPRQQSSEMPIDAPPPPQIVPT